MVFDVLLHRWVYIQFNSLELWETSKFYFLPCWTQKSPRKGNHDISRVPREELYSRISHNNRHLEMIEHILYRNWRKNWSWLNKKIQIISKRFLWTTQMWIKLKWNCPNPIQNLTSDSVGEQHSKSKINVEHLCDRTFARLGDSVAWDAWDAWYQADRVFATKE